MARPPVEWPIPVYVGELRERTVIVCRLPVAALAGRVMLPVHPVVVRGQAVLGVVFSAGRCLKSACGSRQLAGEFNLLEVLTPVTWHPACRAAVRGNWLLAADCSTPGIRRLCRASLGMDLHIDHKGDHLPAATLRRPIAEAPWSAASFFDTAESAETLLLHPECYFVPDRHGAIVRAVPVHQYARSTTHVAPEHWNIAPIARMLGVPEEELEVDHVLYQKRCTHTWAFPAERIPLAQFVAQRPHRADLESLARAA